MLLFKYIGSVNNLKKEKGKNEKTKFKGSDALVTLGYYRLKFIKLNFARIMNFYRVKYVLIKKCLQ